MSSHSNQFSNCNAVVALCVGQTGSGKTSFLNLIRDQAVTGAVGDSDTRFITRTDFKNVTFFDTPGLGDAGTPTSDIKTDAQIIDEIKNIGFINVVLFFMGVQDKIDNKFAYRISEISHLYDVPFTHFCLVVTKVDTFKVAERPVARLNLKKRIYGTFGLINILFTGDFDISENTRNQLDASNFKSDITDFLTAVSDMPRVVPILNYVSTEAIEAAKNKFLQAAFQKNQEIGCYFRFQELSRIKSSFDNNRKGFFGVFTKIADAFTGDTIEAIEDELHRLGTIELPQTSQEKIELYNQACATLDKEMIKRKSRVRFVLLEKDDGTLAQHYAQLAESMKVLANITF